MAISYATISDKITIPEGTTATVTASPQTVSEAIPFPGDGFVWGPVRVETAADGTFSILLPIHPDLGATLLWKFTAKATTTSGPVETWTIGIFDGMNVSGSLNGRNAPAVTSATVTFVESIITARDETFAARDGAVAIVGPVDGTVEGLIRNTGGVGPLTSGALSETLASKWRASTAYVTGDVRQAPDGTTVRRNANGTSASSFTTSPLATPVLAAPTTATTGGTIAAGTTYFYKATALNALGETVGSAEVSKAIAAALATPVNAAFSTATTGGSLAAATYSYRVSATNALGETLASTATTIATTGTTSTVTVNWGAVTGATGYKVYGRTGGTELLIASVGAVTTYTDTGAVTPAGALPTANTTATNTNTVSLTWAAVTGATGYKVYRATAAGGQSTSPALLATLGAVTTYTDTGAAVTAGGVPATNTTSESAFWTAIGAVPGTMEQLSLSDTYAAAARPSWFPETATARARTFDPATGTYNCNARTLPRFRKARAAAVAGIAPLHLAALGDSTTHRANDTDPATRVSWPARMRDTLLRNLGLADGGSGAVFLWNTAGEAQTEPRVDKVVSGGSIGNFGDNYGPYGQNCIQINPGDPANTYLRYQVNPSGLNPVAQYADEIWIYGQTGPDRTQVVVTNGAGAVHNFEIGAYPGETFTPIGGYTAIDPEPGYVRTASPSVNGGLWVAKLPVARRNDWFVQISTASTKQVFIHAVEHRDTTALAGLRVSRVAQAGVSLANLISATNESNGQGGMPLAIDAVQAHLYVIALGLNDFQGHNSVATFKTNLTTAVQRAKATGATGADGFGTGAAADVLLMIQPQPDYTLNPPDHILTPPLADYWEAMYEVADEQDVALIDHSYRWVDAATSAALRRDGIHPNPTGAADLGVSVASVLAGV